MGRINVLDKHTAELIAAGEVVERPASVIKELVENSIDAGSTNITIEIKNGGNTLMRITDNGSGIEKDDIKKAFLRHATSKIKAEDDLYKIATLGFRGEALASISAVSKVDLISRTADCEFGTAYSIHGGDEISFDEVGCDVGTTIIVSDLFYNTPARRKFLKKDTTESNVIITLVERLSISHPEISFKLIKDAKTVINTPGDSKLSSAVFSVFGKEFYSGLLPVDYTLNQVKVSGFVCKSEFARKNRSMQHFCLNGRYIRCKTAIAALEQAFKNEIMVGCYPTCVLNIELDFSQADVNVHPSKMEVRFTDESKVFSAVFYAVKSAINQSSQIVNNEQQKTRNITTPSFEIPQQLKLNNIPANNFADEKLTINSLAFENKEEVASTLTFEKPTISVSKDYSNSFSSTKFKEPDIFVEENQIYNNEKTNEPSEIISQIKLNLNLNSVEDYTNEEKSNININPSINKQNYVSTAQTQSEKEEVEFKLVGQCFETYIILECDNNLLMIDKHAAHERILFEEIKDKTLLEPQMLLVPMQVELSTIEYDLILNKLEKINEFGFEIEDFGSKSVLVRAVPMVIDSQDIKELVQEIAGKLSDKFTDFTPEFLDWLYHSVACRAAIKAGNKSSEVELEALAKKVLNNQNLRHCPHGRPIVIELTQNEIKRRFSRI